jgi:enoyl-CoA hydratase/carnithine racemase
MSDHQAVAKASDGAVLGYRDGPVAIVALNRPDKLNAINRAVLAGLAAAVQWCDADPSVRAMVLRGEGRGFSAGGDLNEVASLVQDAMAFDEFLDEWHATFQSVADCRVPTIAAVHGVALAGGFELLQVCDVVVVGESTTLGDQHANYGLFPAGGSTQRLPRLIGIRAATWLLLSGQAVAPVEAHQMGLVTEVVAEAAVLSRAIEMAQLLSQKSSAASAAIKKALRAGDGLDIRAAIAAERSIAVQHMASEHAQVGLAAFRCRRQPDFTAIQAATEKRS